MPPTPCRLLIDPPAPGPWNMAVDEALLEWAEQTGACALRFYCWDRPTLSLGYFQTFSDRLGHAASQGCPVVRRPSGGGAILHDRELTYSFAAPRAHRLGSRRLDLYAALHDTLIEALGQLGVEARPCQPPPGDRTAAEPFLCFRRRAAGDVLAGGVKVAGSAQRRSRGAVLQHGSVLLARSAAAPELDGLGEAAGRPVAPEQLIEAWLPRLAGRLGVEWRREPLSGSERARATELARSKYESEDWTLRRRGAAF